MPGHQPWQDGDIHMNINITGIHYMFTCRRPMDTKHVKEEKEEKDEKDVGKLFRKSPKKKVVY